MCDVIILQVQLLWTAQSADERVFEFLPHGAFFINALIKSVST